MARIDRSVSARYGLRTPICPMRPTRTLPPLWGPGSLPWVVEDSWVAATVAAVVAGRVAVVSESEATGHDQSATPPATSDPTTVMVASIRPRRRHSGLERLVERRRSTFVEG